MVALNNFDLDEAERIRSQKVGTKLLFFVSSDFDSNCCWY